MTVISTTTVTYQCEQCRKISDSPLPYNFIMARSIPEAPDRQLRGGLEGNALYYYGHGSYCSVGCAAEGFRGWLLRKLPEEPNNGAAEAPKKKGFFGRRKK